MREFVFFFLLLSPLLFNFCHTTCATMTSNRLRSYHLCEFFFKSPLLLNFCAPMTSHRLRSDYMCEFSPFSLPFFLFFPIQFLPHNMGYYDVGQVEVVSDAWFLFFWGFPLPLCYSISATIHGAMRCRRVYIVDVSSHMQVCAAARLIYIVRDLSTVRGAYK